MAKKKKLGYKDTRLLKGIYSKSPNDNILNKL